jgi:acetylglutamate kinase
MTTVIKLGGSLLEPEPAPELMAALARVARVKKIVLVHGGGKALTALLEQLHTPTEFRQGLRVTTPAVLEAALMALAGGVNTRLVTALNAAGLRAVGLTGCDAGMLRAPRLGELGAVGGAPRANARLCRTLLAAGCMPVIASLGVDEAAPDAILNINADQAAAAVAAALGAHRLLFLTDVNGIMDAAGRTIARASLDDLEAMTAAGSLHGGMLPKAAACRAALAGGVTNVSIVGPAAAPALEYVCAGAQLAGTELIP